ncbi:MAG: DUF4252 domain-containing protein [Saprospiraceae bacterium]|nr:DUF4252 domain-containing protein [Saprospiraceae bacterium]
MKKAFIIAILAFAFSNISVAQKDPIRDFFKRYDHSPNATDLRMQGFLIRLAAGAVEEEPAKKLLKKISKLQLLILENGEQPTREDFNRLMENVKADRFEDLVRVTEGDEKVNLLIREKDGVIHDVLILVSEADEFLMLHLECRLRFSDLNDLDIEVDGAEHLKTLPEKRIRV